MSFLWRAKKPVNFFSYNIVVLKAQAYFIKSGEKNRSFVEKYLDQRL